MIVYIDGKSVSIGPVEKSVPVMLMLSVRRSERNDANAYFQGLLNDLRIYNSALDGQEVQQIFYWTGLGGKFC